MSIYSVIPATFISCAVATLRFGRKYNCFTILGVFIDAILLQAIQSGTDSSCRMYLTTQQSTSMQTTSATYSTYAYTGSTSAPDKNTNGGSSMKPVEELSNTGRKYYNIDFYKVHIFCDRMIEKRAK